MKKDFTVSFKGEVATLVLDGQESVSFRVLKKDQRYVKKAKTQNEVIARMVGRWYNSMRKQTEVADENRRAAEVGCNE